MKIPELVYNGPQSDKSGRVHFNFWLYASVSHLLFFFSNLCVHSVQSRQKVKLNNAIVHSSIIVVHGRERERVLSICVCTV